jgi:membrane dipeptidase
LAIDHALQVSKRPLVWSHGWVDSQSGSPRDPFGFVKRKLGVTDARKITAAGGVIGLWGLGVNVAGWGWTARVQDRQGYAREIAKLVKLLGADHVGLGTDMAGVGSNWTVNDYGHVREVIGLLEAEKLDAATIEKVAFGNFARVLKAALPAS